MNAPDRRTLARLLANAGGDWGKLLRDFETTPQPKRGRPSRAPSLLMTTQAFGASNIAEVL